MERESETLNETNDTCLNRLPYPRSSSDTLHEPFLNFDEDSDLSFEDKSVIYTSLVALVKAEYPFDDFLQFKAARLLENLEPGWGDQYLANGLVTELVPSSAGSPSDFIESILTLLSSPHSTVVAAALSFLNETARISSPQFQSRLVESDLISNVLATVQPHTLPISGNETIFDIIINIIDNCLYLASPFSLEQLGKIAAVDQFNHREIIFHKVVIPSSQFVTFLITNRNRLEENLLRSFMTLLDRFIEIGPFHHPTLEFVLASPIAMAFSRCLSFVENEYCLDTTLNYIHRTIYDWKKQSREVEQPAKRMMQALISEGFEDTLEQVLKNDTSGGHFGSSLDQHCHYLSQSLGFNARRQ
ncbi:hypothetical protein BLNAU_7277 [Blattamonas nauphoetae]|uniref:Uncharacterized protein n=1 Tax=Blattamonas nauphoetae TaxID=2049346 RepID=A0ABQ9Y273_9EUKA|nr:hypothetical protein BLNAU_7277 [Blattamonas nauphoetae]